MSKDRHATFRAALADIAARYAEIARLRQALRFYANPHHWSVDGTINAPSPESDYRPDCGDTARAALGPAEVA